MITDFDSIGPCLYSLENTKWVQGTWAGVDALLPHIQPNYKPPFLITRFSGPHFGRIMSEYVIACIISHERNWKEVFENQDRVLWNKDGKIGTYRIISDLHVGILGIGNIGSSSMYLFNSFIPIQKKLYLIMFQKSLVWIICRTKFYYFNVLNVNIT